MIGRGVPDLQNHSLKLLVITFGSEGNQGRKREISNDMFVKYTYGHQAAWHWEKKNYFVEEKYKFIGLDIGDESMVILIRL